MGLRFVHCTDLHISGKNPLYRKDDLNETIKEKIAWINNYAREIRANGILCTVDIFDKPDTSYGVLNKDILSLFKDSPVIWYCIAGNHDMYGYNPDTLSRTPFQTLLECEAIQKVGIEKEEKESFLLSGKEQSIHEAVYQGYCLTITGMDCNALTDNREDKEYDYGGCLEPKKNGEFRIHMAHGFLANKDWGDKISHTKISEIADKIDVDIVLCGHEHSGFGIVEKNGILFINPGSVSRVTSGVGDIGRIPQVAVIDIDVIDGKVVKDAHLVTIAVAKPAEEVIDYEKAQEIKQKKKALQAFTDKLSAENLVIEEDNLSVFDYIDVLKEKVYAESGISQAYMDEIAEEAKNAIREAHEKIGGEL